MDDISQTFDSWAVVELLGHKTIAGRISEQAIGGAALLRIDVPETRRMRQQIVAFEGHVEEVKPGYTKFIGPGSIYCITPTDEATARRCAQEIERYSSPIPVALPRQLPAVAAAGRSDEDAQFEIAGEGEDDEDDDDDEDEDDADEQPF